MKRLAVAVFLLIALAAAIVLLARPGVEASPATFTVNSTADPGDGICDGTECTLREAITAANANAGTDTIEFDIVGAGPHTISPASALPTITDPVIIDGTSEPDFGGTPVIELDGSGAGASVDGLNITAGGSTVKGLVINRFRNDGIELSGSSGNTIEGNYIGTDVSGTADLGNSNVGVLVIGAPNNTIGGTAAGTGNVISGNDQYGVYIYASGATGNQVQGNYIGTDKNGTAALGNSSIGVYIGNVPGNYIGGTATGAGNVISGNDQYGVRIEGSGATGNQVQGNYIGTDVTGTADLGNSYSGVSISSGASNNTIGGSTSGAGNTVAFNGDDGVRVDGATTTANTISGNSIHSNGGKGIENINGGNRELEPPIIDSVGGSVSGHTDPKCYPCTVEVFSDDEDEGRVYHGSTTTNDDTTGTWTYPGAVTGPNITATATHADGATSEFSAPVAYSPPPVGGIAELPDVSGSSASNHLAVAGLAAVALAALTAGAWYARRQWLG